MCLEERRYTGPLSGWSSSGVSAVALPITESAGQASAANCTLVQTVPMWALSSSSFFGIATVVRGDVRFAGLLAQDRVQGRVAAPLGGAAQLQAELRREGERGAVGDLEVRRRAGDPALVAEDLAVTANGSQLVGLRAKSGRSRLIRIERIRSGTPSRI